MKPRFANHKATGLTLTEVLVVVAVLVALAVILLPHGGGNRRQATRWECVSNLRQIGVACRMWADDHAGRFPMHISVTNEGATEFIATGNVAACFSVMSNILDTPKILVCPADRKQIPAVNFATLKNSNISYFVGLDAVAITAQTLLSGDDNLIVNGQRVQPGVINLHTNGVLAWTKERHRGGGNILFGDGSVQQITDADLASAIGDTTNRIVIP